MLSAPLVEAKTGASLAAVQRNLDVLAESVLIREVTGQGRYRVWAAQV
jgi:Fe2+ or Zn2+ uptake regulation protein